MASVAVDEDRRLGRPRSAEADEAIERAAIDLFIEVGYDAFTVEEVAARAGVGKATIYRRHPTKVDLVMAAALRLCEQKGPVPDTGDLRADLIGLAQGYRRMMTATDTGRAIPVLLAGKARNPELARAHEAFVASRRAESGSVVARAIERGDLAPGVDAGLLIDLVYGTVFHRVFVSGQPVDDTVLAHLVDTLLEGVA